MNEQEQQLEAMKKTIMAKILDKSAFERLARVKLANPALAGQLEMYLMQLYQAGQLPTPINDQKLKEILDALTQDRKTKIIRK